jgi:dTDP-N-acetylfucosamine:lipid II N-acetylfucosaminyltransferase
MTAAKGNSDDVEPLLAPRVTGKRYLHLVPDEKFIDDAHALFEEVAPGKHDYLLLSADTPLRYIRDFRPIRLDAWHALRPRVLEVLPDYEAVFVHFLNPAARQVVDAAPERTRFVWIGWGADYYHLIRERGQLLMPETRERLSRIVPGKDPLTRVKKAARMLRRAVKHPVRTAAQVQSQLRLHGIDANQPGELRLLNRVNYFAPVLREDYDAIKGANPGFHPHFLQWNYWTAGMGLLGEAPIASSSACNILLGNSATPENNHLEAMRLIEGAVGHDRKIICPLSYGMPAYASMISNEGERVFGDRFVPLQDYMATAPYLEMLRSCSVTAMNHLRQQAMGNIIMMLWLGARVFLNHENPINKAMASIGVDVYDIRGLPDYLKQNECGPSPDRIMDIRERLDHRFGRDAALRNTLALLARVAR